MDTGYLDLHHAIASRPAGVTWPEGYRLRPNGLWHEEMRLTGPFTVLGEARDPHGNGWAIALEWQDRDGRLHRGFLAHKDLLGHTHDAFKPLVSAGLEITSDAKRLKLLKMAFSGMRTEARVCLVKRCGWNAEVFVLPHKTIGRQEDERFVFDGACDAARYGESGTLKDWIDQIAARSAGNTRLVFAISIAFAGPVNDLIQGEGGGVHLVGGSSLGKTTALIVGGSVWGGGGRGGFAQTWRATANGLESIAAAHSGTCLVLDELGELDGREAGSTAYLLVNGQGKARATRDAELRPRTEWRIMLLSAGEVGLADKIAEGGKKARAGQLVRLIDVPADAGQGQGLFENMHAHGAAFFAEAIKTAAMKHYGVAGPAFVEALAEDPLRTAESIQKMIREIKGRMLAGLCHVDGQVERLASRFALIGAAGTLAHECLNLPWGEGEAEQAALTCFRACLSMRGGEEPGEMIAALQAIRDAVERYGESRFRDLDQKHGLDFGSQQRPVPDLLGYRQTRAGEILWCFTAAGWRETVGAIGRASDIARMLAERGLLVFGDNRAHRHFIKVDDRSVGTYAVRQSALERDVS